MIALVCRHVSLESAGVQAGSRVHNGANLFLTLYIAPERIYNSHYGNGVPAMFSVYLLVLSSWKVNIAENPIVVMGLFGYNLHCWCFIQFLHYRKIHRNMSETFLVFSLTLSPMSTAFYTKEILTCFFLVCHFLPKLLTANIKPCIVIESSHIQNEYAHRCGVVIHILVKNMDAA